MTCRCPGGGALDLVLAVSLSGCAPGPLALAAAAARLVASLLTVGAAGSPLAQVCAQDRGVHIDVGHGRASSRTALWSLLTPVLMAGDALGLINVPHVHLMTAADALDAEAEAARPPSEHFVNPAKMAALQLAGTVPMALADGALASIAARRATAMFARTARVPMTWGELPDDASSVVATFDGPFTAGDGGGAPDDIFAAPFLDAPRQPGVGLLTVHSDPADVGSGLAGAEDAGATVVSFHPQERPPVARLAQLVQRVGYMATYLAPGQEIAPSVSRHVTDLRDRLDTLGA